MCACLWKALEFSYVSVPPCMYAARNGGFAGVPWYAPGWIFFKGRLKISLPALMRAVFWNWARVWYLLPWQILSRVLMSLCMCLTNWRHWQDCGGTAASIVWEVGKYVWGKLSLYICFYIYFLGDFKGGLAKQLIYFCVLFVVIFSLSFLSSSHILEFAS